MENYEGRGKANVSAFISIHILFLVFEKSLRARPAAWDNQHNEWSALERAISMDYAFV